ncbi:transcriptional regulator NrdR [Listeria monocytogenes]|nr:transcriptional regulator NrdR [Listeria monocytogenes]
MTISSICSALTGRFSHALIKPRRTFSRANSSLAPSFFTTIKGLSSTFSKVVKRNPHFSHSRRLRMELPSSAGLESTTRVPLY